MAKKKKDGVEEGVVENVTTNDSLNLATKAIIKKYGQVVTTLNEHEDLEIPTISTGFLSLDIALGRGGMGLGRIYEVYGPHSGGKSTLAINVVIQAQRRGMKCVYIDAEHAVDPMLFKNYGVNLNDLIIAQGFDGEENLDILDRYVKSEAIGVAVVDSVTALVPRAEAEADIDKDSMALQARLMSKALRKITPTANQTGTLIIFINQLRSKLGTYGNPETTTGGEALAFYATGRIAVRGPESKKRRIVDEVTGETIGHKAEFEVVKNKLSAPFRRAEVKLIYGKGYDVHLEILEMATSLGVIDRSGAWYKYGGSNFAQGEIAAVDYIKNNNDFYNNIREQVIDMVGLKEVYERHSQPGPLNS